MQGWLQSTNYRLQSLQSYRLCNLEHLTKLQNYKITNCQLLSLSHLLMWAVSCSRWSSTEEVPTRSLIALSAVERRWAATSIDQIYKSRYEVNAWRAMLVYWWTRFSFPARKMRKEQPVNKGRINEWEFTLWSSQMANQRNRFQWFWMISTERRGAYGGIYSLIICEKD